MTKRDLSAADVVRPVLRGVVADIRSAESAVRLDTAGSAQDLYLTGRRLGSLLASTRPLFETTGELEARLRDCRKAAAPARDVDAVRRRLLLVMADEPPGRVVLRLRERLERQLEGRRRRRWLRLVEFLDDPAFDALARRLDAFADLTPWSAVAQQAAVGTLELLLEHQQARFDKAVHRLSAQSASPEPEAQLRAVRKRAEAVRYLSDAAIPVLGPRAKRTRKTMRRTQTVLTDLRESAALVSYLGRELASSTPTHDERRVLSHLRGRELERVEMVREELFLEQLPMQLRSSAS